MKLPVLPAYYYLDHFREMLSFVESTYGSVLTDEHRAFVSRFNGFTRDGQCLLIRMINRRGAIFNRAHLRYEEIDNVEQALAELRSGGHVRPVSDSDYNRFLECLPKIELLQGARSAGFSDVRTSWAKVKLINFMLTNVPFAIAMKYCGGERFVALDDFRPVEFLLYLYFGKTEGNLKNFALRDLGILRTNKASSFSARFTGGDEARACFHYDKLLERLTTNSEDVHRWAVSEILSGPDCPSDYAADLRGRAAYKVGLYFEKSGEADLARQLYRSADFADCRERLVRLTYSTGEKSEAADLLQRMIEDPLTDDEFTFASDFYARKFGGRRTAQWTDLLRSGETITVDDTHRGNPEAGVAAVMRRRGYRVFFAENALWQSLFGLFFWDELFESGQLHSNFDWMPHCLKNRTFSTQFAKQIEEKLSKLRSGEGLNLILKVVTAKWGRPNGLFAWDYVNVEALRLLLEGASLDGLAAIVRTMCDDYRAMRDGFPDLMLAKGGSVSFIEVKAEGDVIRRNQLTRLRQLGTAGITASIGRVDYRFDPDQEYVVVDIETTGGWTASDRITEIGAVKIRNHQIIGEWHSLLNPQRSIPSKIVQLTGITNEMVRGAPLFSEIADSFMDFMGDSIFVAHNVNFDYGFISAEFERLEGKFRFPKVCTCAGMRRSFPGHKSYGLGNLCRTFGIDLEGHHRALCDARAATSLLNLINAKRQSGEKELDRAA